MPGCSPGNGDRGGHPDDAAERAVRRLHAQQLGLVGEVVPDEQLRDRTMQLAGELAARAPLAVRVAKRMMRRSLELTFEQSLGDAEYAVNIVNDSEDVQEGVAAFLEKRAPVFRGRSTRPPPTAAPLAGLVRRPSRRRGRWPWRTCRPLRRICSPGRRDAPADRVGLRVRHAGFSSSRLFRCCGEDVAARLLPGGRRPLSGPCSACREIAPVRRR